MVDKPVDKLDENQVCLQVFSFILNLLRSISLYGIDLLVFIKF